MKAIISRLLPSLILQIGCLLILPTAAAHARASETEQSGSVEYTPPALREAVSASPPVGKASLLEATRPSSDRPAARNDEFRTSK